MNELDEVWTQMMQQAIATAKDSGRTDVAEYLALKASNDAIRSVSCQWLFDSFFELSEIANRKGIKLEIENESPHRFAVGNSTMVGSLIRFRHGIRCLTVETGWTRTPADGFMRHNAFAHAKISHFGLSKANIELILLRNNQNSPSWVLLNEKGASAKLTQTHLAEHFNLFLDL